MSFVYKRVENIKYKGFSVFYKEPINTEMHNVKEFSNKYQYFYKEKEEDYISLGKFLNYSRFNCGNPFDDRDYKTFVFEKNKQIFEDKIKNIYCCGIEESDEDMYLIEDMKYTCIEVLKSESEYPMYYSIQPNK
jgi:hypothetical protein